MRKTLKGKKFCSPKTKTNKKINTCYSRKQLLQMTKKWNKHNKKKINLKSKKKKVVWHQLNNKLGKTCNTEWCWNKQLLNIPGIFRPDMPAKWKKNPREWLDSNNIINVMKQYENDRDDFTFIGPVPIDFDLKNKSGMCMVDDLCSIEVKTLDKKKTKIGIIFNLDKHDEPGSHWTALFVDTDRKGIFYFDSYGYPPENEIVELMDKLQHQYKQLGINMKKHINNIRHQYKFSECGMYCINFIIKMLTTKTTFSRFCKKIIDDDTMLSYRKKYFLV